MAFWQTLRYKVTMSLSPFHSLSLSAGAASRLVLAGLVLAGLWVAVIWAMYP